MLSQDWLDLLSLSLLKLFFFLLVIWGLDVEVRFFVSIMVSLGLTDVECNFVNILSVQDMLRARVVLACL